MGLLRILHLQQALFSMVFKSVMLTAFGFPKKGAQKEEVFALFTAFFIEKNHNA